MFLTKLHISSNPKMKVNRNTVPTDTRHAGYQYLCKEKQREATFFLFGWLFCLCFCGFHFFLLGWVFYMHALVSRELRAAVG